MTTISKKTARQLSYDNLRNKYIALFKNILEFENLDIDSKNYLMNKVLYNGQIAAFNLKTPSSVDYKELAFATFTEVSWKWNDAPKEIRVLNARNAPYFPEGALKVDEEAVILKLDFRPINYINEYVQRIYDIQATINTNLIVHKLPFIIKSTDNKTVSTIERILANENIVSLDDLTLEVLETKAPYLIDKLQLYLSETEAELLTILGIDNVKFEKKAQMTKDEVNANNEEITSYRRLYKAKFEAFFEKINEILGHNITIKEIEPDEIIVEDDGEEEVENELHYR